MLTMPIVSLLDEARRLVESGNRVSVLWQHADSLVFVARGREYRSEFHINPSDETMYMIRGEMNLHYRTPEGKEERRGHFRRLAHLHAGRHAPLPAFSARCLCAHLGAKEAGRRSRSLPLVLPAMRRIAARRELRRARLRRGSRFQGVPTLLWERGFSNL